MNVNNKDLYTAINKLVNILLKQLSTGNFSSYERYKHINRDYYYYYYIYKTHN
jgi:ribosome-associated translation inhibitor RaiA